MNLRRDIDIKAIAPEIEREVLSLLGKQKGFAGGMSFISADGAEGIAVSFWTAKEDLDAYLSEKAPQVAAVMGRLGQGPLVAKNYEVAASTLHTRVASA
jgi:hypothetical protein